jgi:hypothetical protein
MKLRSFIQFLLSLLAIASLSADNKQVPKPAAAKKKSLLVKGWHLCLRQRVSFIRSARQSDVTNIFEAELLTLLRKDVSLFTKMCEEMSPSVLFDLPDQTSTLAITETRAHHLAVLADMNAVLIGFHYRLPTPSTLDDQLKLLDRLAEEAASSPF